MFLITDILIIYYHYTKTFAFWFSFRLQSQADGTFSVINYMQSIHR